MSSEIEWSMRSQLSGDISKWLLGFFVTWDDSFPASVTTLRRLCGSSCASITAFRQMLRESLGQLKTIGFLYDWRMDTEYVWVSRDPTQVINRIKPTRLLSSEEAMKLMAKI